MVSQLQSILDFLQNGLSNLFGLSNFLGGVFVSLASIVVVYLVAKTIIDSIP